MDVVDHPSVQLVLLSKMRNPKFNIIIGGEAAPIN
jgi:hypothetical protein